MCGRFYLPDSDLAEIRNIITQIDKKYKSQKSYQWGDIYPTNTVPVIATNRNQIDCQLMSWGYPKWDSTGVIINARAETALEKRMFSASLQQYRCVIPASGFYEWQKKDPAKPKEKYLFSSSEDSLLYMAGIYQAFPVNEEISNHFVILTRTANISIADIHQRMPVVMRKKDIESWLKDFNAVNFILNQQDLLLNRIKIESEYEQLTMWV